MGELKDKRSRAHHKLARKERKIARKHGARADYWKRIRAAQERIRNRERIRGQVGAMGRDRLLTELRQIVDNKEFQANFPHLENDELRERLRTRLTNLIKDDKRAVEQFQKHLKELTSAIQRLKDVAGDLRDWIRKLTKKIQAKPPASKGINETPGDPHWGGSRDVFWNEVVPAAGVNPHSTKRTETFGNPGSDHHVSQTLAYAGDFLPSEARAIAIGRALGISYSGYADDYKGYYIQRDGHTYRVQIIAANHGTGPHVHVGIERVN